jgi:hypothetical protein
MACYTSFLLEIIVVGTMKYALILRVACYNFSRKRTLGLLLIRNKERDMRKLIAVLLVLNLIVLAGCVSPKKPSFTQLDEITGPDTEEGACKALVARVAAAGLFPSINKECLFCELEGDDGRTFQIALRFNKEKCGGDWASTLLDRFLVCQRSPVILWYDSSQDRYLPWEYTVSYENSK